MLPVLKALRAEIARRLDVIGDRADYGVHNVEKARLITEKRVSANGWPVKLAHPDEIPVLVVVLDQFWSELKHGRPEASTTSVGTEVTALIRDILRHGKRAGVSLVALEIVSDMQERLFAEEGAEPHRLWFPVPESGRRHPVTKIMQNCTGQFVWEPAHMTGRWTDERRHTRPMRSHTVSAKEKARPRMGETLRGTRHRHVATGDAGRAAARLEVHPGGIEPLACHRFRGGLVPSTQPGAGSPTT